MPSLKTASIALCVAAQLSAIANQDIMLSEMPDYEWHAGCFGTASGNLMGYWDRHGYPNFYVGPTNDGLAPLDSYGVNAGVNSLWASRAGWDGRPDDKPGHLDDYWDNFSPFNSVSGYESGATDPYKVAGREEHAPDCLGDFMGSSQNKWTDLDGECSGNINAFSFNFWDKQGNRRVNFTPPSENGVPIPDIQSGWRAWAKSRGAEAESFSQLADFNPNVPTGKGFTFEDMKAEIDAGYPVMLFLQRPTEFSRNVGGMSRGNPLVHGMVAYGYYITDSGMKYVRYKTSWGSTGTQRFAEWGPQDWEAGLPLRGVVGFHPMPKIKSVEATANGVQVKWDGPASVLMDLGAGTNTPLHWYVVEKATTLSPANFTAITEASTNLDTTIAAPAEPNAFYRVRLVPAPAQ